jgi:hypothetical protein
MLAVVQPMQGMTPQRITFDVEVGSLTRPRRLSLARQARAIQKRFRARIPTEPALQVAAAIFGAVAMALEDSRPRRSHNLDFTFIGADGTTIMLRGEAQKAMSGLGDEWWSRLASELEGHTN